MAVYMLEFNIYTGFEGMIRDDFGGNKEGMFKRIYEYAKRIK